MERRTILVTGGTRGIGRAVVDTLVEAGAHVSFTYRDAEGAARALERVHGDRVRAYPLDLGDRSRPEALVEEIERDAGAIEGLVNNAGFRRDALCAMTSDAHWDAVVDGNLGGAFRTCRAVLPAMVKRRRGTIVNVASLSALHGVAGQAAYAAAKAGVLALTRVLAKEMGRRGIRVNAVVPGFVATDMTADLPEAAVAALRSGECLKRGVEARDVAATVAFLISDASAATTGQVLVVDAGTTS